MEFIYWKKVKRWFKKNSSKIVIWFPIVVIAFIIMDNYNFINKKVEDNKKERLKIKKIYIELFISSLIANHTKRDSLEKQIFSFISNIQKKDTDGFIFIFYENGTLKKHSCAYTLMGLQNIQDRNRSINPFIEASKGSIIKYNGTNCFDDNPIKKLAITLYIKEIDAYIAITKSLDTSQQQQKKSERELDDQFSMVNISLLLISLLSFLFSLWMSYLIKESKEDIKNSNDVMIAQSRLAQAGELLSMISHQWRQPISKIASTCASLRFEIAMGDRIEEEFLDGRLEEMEGHTEFLSETIDDFREFYRPQQHKEFYLVLPIIEKSISFLETEIERKNIKIKKIFDIDDKILCNSNELIQVLTNIIQNAIDFSKDRASITIRTILEKNYYIIEIEDEAGGIKEENLDKIFEANFSTKTLTNSTNLGLGLYLSKTIIEEHFDGTLEVSSVNNSSIFTIRLKR